MPKLTQKVIDTKIATATSRVILRDTEVQCFAVRISPDSASYFVECKFNGKTKRVTLGRTSLLTLEQARQRAREVLLTMKSGVDPDAEKKIQKHASITLREVLQVYLATRQLRPGTIDVYRRIGNHAFKEWLDKPITSITKDMVEDKHRAMANGSCRRGASGRAYANCAFKLLQALLNFADEKYSVDGQPLIPVNPVSRLTKTRAWYRVHPRTGVVPEYKIGDWYRAVRQLKKKTVSDYFLLLLFTGLRRKDALMLKWADIDFEARTLTVRREQSKTNRDHVLPVTDFLFDLLQERYSNRGGNPYIFPGKGNKGHLADFKMWLQEVREKSGCRFTIHDLRRSYLSAAERLELPYYVLKRLAGHKVSSDTLVPYIVVSMERLRAHAEKISRHFLDLIQEHAAAS